MTQQSMTRPANIRNVSPAERNEELLNRLTSVWEESVRATHHFLQESDIVSLKPCVIEGLTYIRHLYVVSDGDAPVAFIGIQDGKIEMLFVLPQYFRKGIGRQLVDIAVRYHQAIFVDVNEQNPEARAFYEKLGFVAFDRTETDSQGNHFPIIAMKQKEFSLQTERLVVRSLQIHDTDMLHAFMGRREVMYAWEHGFTKEEVREWIDRQIYRYYSKDIGYWGVALRDNPEVLIGQAGLMRTTINGNEVVEMGYIFDNTYWHNGYATEAAENILAYAFDCLHLPAVYCSIRPENNASIRVAERLNMKPVGSHTVFYRGKNLPHIIYKTETVRED